MTAFKAGLYATIMAQPVKAPAPVRSQSARRLRVSYSDATTSRRERGADLRGSTDPLRPAEGVSSHKQWLMVALRALEGPTEGIELGYVRHCRQVFQMNDLACHKIITAEHCRLDAPLRRAVYFKPVHQCVLHI